MKITNVKAMVAKMFTFGLLAGALVIAAPTKAEAQVSFGVRVGPVAVYHAPYYRGPVYPGPIYGGPAYPYGYAYRPGFYGPRYGWDRHEYFEHRDHFYGRR